LEVADIFLIFAAPKATLCHPMTYKTTFKMSTLWK